MKRLTERAWSWRDPALTGLYGIIRSPLRQANNVNILNNVFKKRGEKRRNHSTPVVTGTRQRCGAVYICH